MYKVDIDGLPPARNRRCLKGYKVLVPSVGTGTSDAIQRSWTKAGLIELIRYSVEGLLSRAFERCNVVENPIIVDNGNTKPQSFFGKWLTDDQAVRFQKDGVVLIVVFVPLLALLSPSF